MLYPGVPHRRTPSHTMIRESMRMILRRSARVLLAGLMISGCVLTGCSSAQTESASSASAQPTAETTEPVAAETRTVVDSDGNEVTIPAEVTKVAPSMGAFAQVTEMLTQGDGKIAAASTSQISDAFKEVFSDYAQTNPNDYDSSSVEDVIAAGAQVVYGPTSMYTDEQKEQLEKAGIAIVALNNIGSVEGLCESILTIGQILGDDEYAVAQDFVAHYRDGIADAEKRTADIADADKKTVVQLNMAGDAYVCADDSDISASYYRAAGAVNVAADYDGAQNGQYRTVDAEQLVVWDPEYIVTMNANVKDAIMNDAALASIQAVKNGNVYVCPTALYLWCVRSAEGSLMTPWLGTVIYPELFDDVDMVDVLQDFYTAYYNATLSDADAEKIIAGETSLSSGGGGGQGR